MSPKAIDKPDQVTTRDTMPGGDSCVLDDFQTLWDEVRGLGHDRLLLAALETQLAGQSLVVMVVAGVMVALLLIGALLGIETSSVLSLIENGLSASHAILLAIAFNLLLVLILAVVIRRKSRYLQFPATLRSLRPMPSGQSDTEKS